MRKFLKDTQINLWMGLRLISFRPCGSPSFVINGDQIAVLMLIDLALTIAISYLSTLPEPLFNTYALPDYFFRQLISWLLIFIIAKFWKKSWPFLATGIVILNTTAPVLDLIIGINKYVQNHTSNPTASPYSALNLFIVLAYLYLYVILWRVFYIASNHQKALASVALLTLIFSGGLQTRVFGETTDFWYHPDPEDNEDDDRWAEYRKMDAEQLMYRQPDILSAALQTLTPQRKHLSELFFIGFAGYASEDVFSKEVTFAKNMLDTRFGTQGHSINLVNHLHTRDNVPLANATNLAATLKRIGSIMDKDEDVLMLYMTSHGSRDHRFAVSFWPLALNDITPEKLRAMLDNAGIKWRVIIVSACYSGGFIKALESDDTLIATAAAADKTSFGCGTASEFTYFGEAVFKDLLPHDYAIIAALKKAQITISEREKREGIEASLPQLFVGKAIEGKLESLGKEIGARVCGGGKSNNTTC
ncbi:hypothetical protein KFZ76_08505 [Methylovulum psychrotolerans]|uniref:C13 family peptidase n=1 Tax=Methylovulum psychrotolerans TaxID=1704499 RepID=UPI001BFF818C|nr:C13 family peptidase [Methylovulum psychrotolerans]MBT9097746.1 hypothetical protein [Methylovulum psychrotolerans]